jgi:dihydroneopterin aldolase
MMQPKINDCAIIGLFRAKHADNMDKIFLNDLKIDAIIGIYDWERQATQTLRFDLEMDYDIRAAAASDAISDTLDYGAIAQAVVAFVERSEYQLIETLAEDLAALLLSKFSIPKLKLSLTKPVKLYGQNFAKIVIERSA